MMKVTISTIRMTIVMIHTFLHLAMLLVSPLMMALATAGATNPGMDPIQFVNPMTVPIWGLDVKVVSPTLYYQQN